MRKICAYLPVLTLLIRNIAALGKLWGDLKPQSFKKGDKIDVHVGRLWSAVLAPMPYDFYSLNWCDSTAGHKWDSGYNIKFENSYQHDERNENLHESPFMYTVGQKDGSRIICKKNFNHTDQSHFIDMIRDRYRYQLFLDGLPNALITKNEKSKNLEVNFREGILVGERKPDKGYIINNHLHFTVKVHHVAGGDEVRIVGFEVQPFSINANKPLDYDSLGL